MGARARSSCRSWGEGFGAADDALPPSIFIVGDRKQSIYGFRDADVAVLDEAAEFIGGAAAGRRAAAGDHGQLPAAPGLLAFVNEVFADDRRRRPTPNAATRSATRTTIGFRSIGRPRRSDAIGRASDCRTIRSASSPAPTVADDRRAGRRRDRRGCCRRRPWCAIARPASRAPARAGRHRDPVPLARQPSRFEAALERRGVPTYVYKGLGFFDADEIQDAVALLRYLADPLSDLRAAALLRSRLVRLSDAAIALLGRRLADALLGAEPPAALAAARRRGPRACSSALRRAVPRWLALVDRMPPSELLDAVLRETAYAFEMRGSRWPQARENLKKLRGHDPAGAQNRGYATLGAHRRLLDGSPSATSRTRSIDAVDAVSLMTVHAAKGLEFPIVFVVNMQRGTGGPRAPIRVLADGTATPSVAIADFSRRPTRTPRRASARRPSACCTWR